MTLSGRASAAAGLDRAALVIRNLDDRSYVQPNGTLGPRFALLGVSLTPVNSRDADWSVTLTVPDGRYNARLLVWDDANVKTEPRPDRRFSVI